MDECGTADGAIEGATARPVWWQARVKPGHCFVSDSGEDFPVFAKVLEGYHEKHLHYYGFCRCCCRESSDAATQRFSTDLPAIRRRLAGLQGRREREPTSLRTGASARGSGSTAFAAERPIVPFQWEGVRALCQTWRPLLR